VFLATGEVKAAAARELGISASTVTERIRRHLARAAQDDAATQAEATEQDAASQAEAAGVATEPEAETEAADAQGRDGHEHAAEAGDPQAPGAEAAPAKPEKEYVTECVDCGFKFSRPQARKTCQSAKACKRRQDEKAAAAAAE
jgi:hypothetical protein